MGKSLVNQVKAVWAASRILQPGRSRFQDKVAARDQFHREGVGATSARIADHTPITSYRTYDAYKSVTLEFAKFAERLGVRQVRDLRPEHAQAFMLSKLESGRSCNTLRSYSAALGKFDVALSRVPRAMGIPAEARLSPGLDAARAQCNMLAPRLDMSRRAYADPQSLVNALPDGGQRLVARLQLEAGFRISEVLSLGRASLRGETRDHVTGRWSGIVHVVGKGGYAREQYVPLSTYRRLASHLDEHGGSMGQEYKPYLAALHRAADAVAEAWGGTHGLRHNYVRGFLLKAAEHGLGSDACMREVMHRVGHHRLAEVKTYLR